MINTGTTIVTFLMVFLIQSTQNRDTGAMQVKLDELIRAVRGANNALLNLEDLGEEELARVRTGYEKIAQKAREDARHGVLDTGCPDVRAVEKAAELVEQARGELRKADVRRPG